MQVRSALAFCLSLAHAGSEAIVVARDNQPQDYCQGVGRLPDEQPSLNNNAVDPILTPQEVMPENFWDSADASIWKLDGDDEEKCGSGVRDCHDCSGRMITSDKTHAVGDASLAVDKQGRCTKPSSIAGCSCVF
ncbi:hypothetical protein AC578_7314 [Pseudocercospora eumusae]|uniref:Uncharacterized protein n=1 Tax=Pseudocercospora eumusae TaxID=321146 RepID=A0A139HX40_9PEZI|nr:hypothetical protein AC578_7314 [Pseudocercospora eumusae]